MVGSIHGIQVARRTSTISHLFFAYDSLLFFKVNFLEVGKVMNILST